MAGQRFFSFCWFSIRCQMPMSHDNQCENTSIISCQCVISLGFNFRHSFLVQVSWWAAQLTSHMPAPTSKTFIHIQRVYFSFLSESPTRRAEWARGAGLRTAPANSAPSTTSALWGGERERERVRGGQQSLSGQPVGTSGVATPSTAATVATVCDPEALSRSPSPS